MKKQVYIYIAIGLILAGIAYFLLKKGSHARRLYVDVGDMKPVGTDISAFLGTSFDMKVDVKLQNYSSSAFNIEQLKIDIYTDNDVKLASQKEPLSEVYTVEPNANNTLTIDMQASLHGIADILTKSGLIDNTAEAVTRLVDWVTTGNLGLEVKAKGFVVAEGVKININQDVTI